MNSSVMQFLFIVLMMSLGLGCTGEPASELKADDIDVHDDFARQTSNIKPICPNYALIYLIGSSESAGSITSWNIDFPNRLTIEINEKNSAKKFQAAIEKAKHDLTKSFAKDPKCGESFHLVFAAIIDGPENLDSSIETIHYGMTAKTGGIDLVWKRLMNRQWSLKGNKLVPRKSKFELNMAQDVATIIQIMAKNTHQSLATDNSLSLGLSIIPDQIHYILKTHGARVSVDPKHQPTLENMKAYPREDITSSQWQPAILMDTNGPTSPLSSSVFSAYWNPEDIDEVQAFKGKIPGGESSADASGDSILSNTSGDGIFDTAGEIGMTSGSKSLSFQDSLLDNAEPTYLGKRSLGAFATYANVKGNTSSIGESTQIKFPVGNAQTGGKNLIILDSCYASEKILHALEYADGTPNKTVVLASINELYFEFFDYSKLDLANFLKMPVLLEKLKKNANLKDSEKELLSNMTKGTLNWQNNETKATFKQLAIWIDQKPEGITKGTAKGTTK